jgi:predicted N-acyltransferase
MSLDVQLLSRVEEVGQEAWDRLSGDIPFASYRWYRFGETVLVDDVPIYLILSSDGEPVARATFWLKHQETLPIASRAVRCLVATILHRWPLLVCRSPLSSTSGLVLPEPPLRDLALKAIVRQAWDLAQQYGASLLLFDYLERQALDWPVWQDRFVKVPDLHPGTYLTLSWPDFESYLSHLDKKRRYNVRRTYRLVSDEGIRIKCYQTVENVDRAMELHERINARYRSPTDSWMRRAMEHAGMVDAVWLAATRGDSLLGCELMLGDRESWFVMGLGLDQDVKNVYFVLGYEDIRCAIERGARVLRWGTGTYDVKRRLGFRTESNSNLVFGSRSSLLQRLGRWIVAHGLSD